MIPLWPETSPPSSRSAERQATGSALHSGLARGSDPQVAPFRTQQIGHRPPPAHLVHFGAAYLTIPESRIL